MASGEYLLKTRDFGNGSQIFYKFVWESTPNDDGLSSTFNWRLIYYQTYGGIRLSGNGNWTVDIDGVVTTGKTKLYSYPTAYEEKLIAEGSCSITHNADGNKTVNITFKHSSWHSNSYDTGSCTAVLDNIRKDSEITCSTVNIGVAPLISIYQTNPNFTHTISYGFGNQELGYITGTIVEKTSSRSINNFVWPQSFYQVIPNTTSGTGTLFCEMFDGEESIGTVTCEFTANANKASSDPILAAGHPTIVDTNATTVALTGDSSKLIRYRSTATVTIGAQARNYATIVRQKVGNAGWYHEERTSDIVTIGFGNVESGYFSFELEDSRGYITYPGRDLAVAGRFIEYVLPSCNIGQENLPDAAGNMTVICSGKWFGESFGAANNTIAAQYRYKVEGGSYGSWTDMSVSTNGNNYSATGSVSGLNYQSTYIFQTRAIDKLSTTESIEYKVKAIPVFSWSEDDFQFHVDVFDKDGNPLGTGGGGGGADLSEGGTINGDLTITGNLRLKAEGSNYGNYIYFGDSQYATISETPSDDTLTIKATNVNINGTVKVNGTAITAITTGGWIPTLNSSAISSYTSRSGSYTKVGNIVTVSFFIKATCNSGYDSTTVSIGGLPFAPATSAAGGGMCSGCYMNAGWNFQCWVAETSGSITSRVQSCNNTSAANISTSGSGCFYRSGGGEITLSGTIAYATNE